MKNKLATEYSNTIEKPEKVLNGTLICPGIVIGQIHVVDTIISIPQSRINTKQIIPEQVRYTEAINTAKQHLRNHIENMHSNSLLEAQTIFEGHQAILSDEFFHNQVRDCIKQQGRCVEFCLEQEAQRIINKFNNMRDPYLQDRGEDIRDLAVNLLGILSGNTAESLHRPIQTTDILISQYLHPTDVASIHHANELAGFASESKALTSHAAILLKGFGIPSIGKIVNLLKNVEDKMPAILDANRGILIANPSTQTWKEYKSRMKIRSEIKVPLSSQHCITKKGEKITLLANIENPKQAELVLTNGLEGIGLFRTEFLIISSSQIPSEDDQYRAYRSVLETVENRRVNIRTFDIGGDKQMGLDCKCTGRNPSLGIRGIRRHLIVDQDELRIQLRAILRASYGYDTGLLIPMVTTLDEIVQTKQILKKVKQTLLKDGIKFSESIKFGVMIETPAAAIATRNILSMVDFINLGTNDLLQYVMVADRDNEQVLDYNDSTNPAFLWLLKFILNEAKKIGRGTDVAICGEIASDLEMIPKLIKMGYRSFSIAPVIANSFRKLCHK